MYVETLTIVKIVPDKTRVYPSPVDAHQVRPQSVMLSFLGLYLRGREQAVSTGSLIEVFSRVGVGEEAVRSTVARMVRRGLLARHPRGRRVYVGLTDRSAAVLNEGHDRMWVQGAVNRDWDGTWTVITFTLPDDRRRDRHDLRTRLQWAGFGPLQGGVWAAAGRRDVLGDLAPLELDGHLVAFSGELLAPTAVDEVIGRAFDLDAIGARYADFLRRWTGVAGSDGDPMAHQLLLHTDWLDALRLDPHLPVEHLPAGWPAIEAEQVFRDRAETWGGPATREASRTLDMMSLAEV